MHDLYSQQSNQKHPMGSTTEPRLDAEGVDHVWKKWCNVKKVHLGLLLVGWYALPRADIHPPVINRQRDGGLASGLPTTRAALGLHPTF